MFLTGRKLNTTVCTMMFFTSGSKKYGIYNAFWPAPSTNTVFTKVSPCNKMWLRDPTRTKYCKLQCFESALRVRGRRGGGGIEMTSNLLNNQVTGLAALPFTS